MSNSIEDLFDSIQTINSLIYEKRFNSIKFYNDDKKNQLSLILRGISYENGKVNGLTRSNMKIFYLKSEDSFIIFSLWESEKLTAEDLVQGFQKIDFTPKEFMNLATYNNKICVKVRHIVKNSSLNRNRITKLVDIFLKQIL